MDSKGTQPYVYVYPFSPRLPSHPGCHIALSRVPVLYGGTLLASHLKYGIVYMSIPKTP